ncbi:MAG TPA: hypothetical protein VKN99_17855 [Polyangia bacterium]|nr:hypothetical protein [Polyangia bacterium]
MPKRDRGDDWPGHPDDAPADDELEHDDWLGHQEPGDERHPRRPDDAKIDWWFPAPPAMAPRTTPPEPKPPAPPPAPPPAADSTAPEPTTTSTTPTATDPIKQFELIEFEDVLFRKFSAVIPPDHPLAADGSPNPSVTGIGIVASCIKYASENPDRELLVAGHADVHPSEAYKLKISQQRAAMARALIQGDRNQFAELAQDSHRVEDYQQILKWVAQTRGWSCDPGKVDGQHGSGTTRALRSFQQTFNQEKGGSLAESGAMDGETWKAFFDCYEEALCDTLEADEATLSSARASMSFLDPSAVGCGNHHPTTGPYRSQTNRRVEMLFFEQGQEPSLACHAGGGCNPAACEIYDTDKYQRIHITPPIGPLKRKERHPFRFGFSNRLCEQRMSEVFLHIDSNDGTQSRVFAMSEGVLAGGLRVFQFDDAVAGLHYHAFLVCGSQKLMLAQDIPVDQIVNPGDPVSTLAPAYQTGPAS